MLVLIYLSSSYIYEALVVSERGGPGFAPWVGQHLSVWTVLSLCMRGFSLQKDMQLGALASICGPAKDDDDDDLFRVDHVSHLKSAGISQTWTGQLSRPNKLFKVRHKVS